MSGDALFHGKAGIASVAVATPPYTTDQVSAEGFIKSHYSAKLSPRSLSIIQKVFSHPSISRRSFAFDSPECLLDEDPDSRIARFTHWAVELSAEASRKALEQAGLAPGDVSALVVNTCTGYICPGLSTYLIERLGLSPRTRAFDLVGSGCGGALPNLHIAGSLPNGDGVALSVSVEICSATFQMEDDLSLIVSNALFADGAAASVVWDRPEGLGLVASSSRYAPEHRDAIRYVHKDGRLYNQLSTTLHRLVKSAVAQAVRDVLEPMSLRVEDVRHWALHTGGEKIINSIKGELGLSEEQLRATRSVLSNYGNMSSPTVWFVLRELMEAGIEKGDWCVMAAFGAGLSAHAFLLRMS
jgi:predicted naringenin-chalcone synthase